MSDDIPFKEKIKTLGFAQAKNRGVKVTVNEIAEGHTVDETEHWDGRVDVCVKPPPITLDAGVQGSAEGD